MVRHLRLATLAEGLEILHDDGFFDATVAAAYDDDPEMFDPSVIAATVDRLVELVGDGRALEFAIGTGRIALPLWRRGVEVAGIELSTAMVAQLRRKAGGAALRVAIGDMTTTRLPGAFQLVYLLFNTINNLTTQAAQIACFRNAAAHLTPGMRREARWGGWRKEPFTRHSRSHVSVWRKPRDASGSTQLFLSD